VTQESDTNKREEYSTYRWTENKISWMPWNEMKTMEIWTKNNNFLNDRKRGSTNKDYFKIKSLRKTCSFGMREIL
jgi:hypothetical protein